MGMNLGLRQNLELCEIIFAKLKLDLEIFCPERRAKMNLTYIIFVQRSKRETWRLEIICPSKKGEGE